MKKMKSAALALTSAMLLSAVFGVTGCNKKNADNGDAVTGKNGKSVIKNTVEEIESDSLWFDYSQKTIQVFDEGMYLHTFVDTNIIKTKDGFATYAVAVPDTFDQIAYNYIVLFDSEGNLTDKVEINTQKLGVSSNSYVELLNVMDDNGDVAALICVQTYNSETYDTKMEYYKYNVKTGNFESLDYLVKSYASALGGLNNGYTYSLCSYVDKVSEEFKYGILIGKDGKLVQEFDVAEAFNGKSIYDIEFISKTNDTILFEVEDASNSYILSIDTNNMSLTKKAWQEVFGDDEYSYEKFLGEDGKVYYAKEDGIYCKDNMDEPLLPYTASYADIYKLSKSRIISADGQHFVLLTVDYSDNEVKTSIHIFDEADSNPNAGKSVITVGYVNELQPDSSAAISAFNANSDDYYITTKCYSADYANAYSVGMSSDDMKAVDMMKSGEIANELAMDLLAGDGPDIILNLAGDEQLNNDTYLLDVASFIDSDLSDLNLFDNVIDASKVGDALYQVPLTFYVEGIWAETDKVKGANGFTFDEYKDYVSNVCNGKNPIANNASRLDVMTKIMSTMSDEFYNGEGNVDFQNEAFYTIAEYCKDNVSAFYVPSGDEVNYYGQSHDYEHGYGYGIEHFDNKDCYVYNIDAYLKAIGFNPDLNLYGLPSNDGRGPAISVESSVAISSAASDVDGAKEFVKFLIEWGENTDYTNSISVDVTRATSKYIVDQNNKYYDVSSEYDSEDILRAQGIFRFDYDVINNYIDILETASTVQSFDPNIMIIVNEEVQAYFAGQKSIEDVASIIQNRAQTVIDER